MGCPSSKYFYRRSDIAFNGTGKRVGWFAEFEKLARPKDRLQPTTSQVRSSRTKSAR
jgi:hypothetical protein